MNLGIICNIKNKKPECVIAHDYQNEDIGYVTYNNKLSESINVILNNDIYSQVIFNDNINYSICDKKNSYYVNVLNDYLPYPYRVLWVKKVIGNIEDILEQSYQILEMEENKNEKIN